MRPRRIGSETPAPPCTARRLGAFLGACLLVLLCAQSLPAEPARDAYMKADACYQKLVKQPQRAKYRQHWLTCIDQFQSACRAAPNGPWPAAFSR